MKQFPDNFVWASDLSGWQELFDLQIGIKVKPFGHHATKEEILDFVRTHGFEHSVTLPIRVVYEWQEIAIEADLSSLQDQWTTFLTEGTSEHFTQTFCAKNVNDAMLLMFAFAKYAD